jgi:hypothetical protein
VRRCLPISGEQSSVASKERSPASVVQRRRLDQREMNRVPSAYLMCPGSQSARTCQDLSIAAVCGLIPQPSTARAATGPAPRYPSTWIARIGGFPLSGTIARPTTARQASDLAWSAFS